MLLDVSCKIFSFLPSVWWRRGEQQLLPCWQSGCLHHTENHRPSSNNNRNRNNTSQSVCQTPPPLSSTPYTTPAIIFIYQFYKAKHCNIYSLQTSCFREVVKVDKKNSPQQKSGFKVLTTLEFICVPWSRNILELNDSLFGRSLSGKSTRTFCHNNTASIWCGVCLSDSLAQSGVVYGLF